MRATWSNWRREGGRRRRHIEIDGSRYTQLDHAGAAIHNSSGEFISQAVAQALGIPRASTPRTTPDRRSPTQTSQINPENVEPNEHFEIATKRRQPSTGTGVRSIPEDDAADAHNDEDDADPQDEDDYAEAYDEGADDTGARPDILLNPKKARQPLTGTELQSVLSIRTKSSLPPGYVRRKSKFFVLGTVFRVLWAEAKGTTARDYQGDDEVYKTLRPMIVVNQMTAHCICAPIFSYGNQGVGKSGLKESEVQHHAVVQMEGRPARLMSAELEKWRTKIRMEDAFTVKPILQPNSEPPTLSISSRVRFDATYPVRYNLKVLIIGRVIEDDLSRLQDRWRAANWPNSS